MFSLKNLAHTPDPVVNINSCIETSYLQMHEYIQTMASADQN